MLKLERQSISWAIKSLNYHHDTYLFPFPFEYHAINESETDVINHIRGLDIYKEGIRSYRTALTPKSHLGFRIATQLDPIDSIISHSILYEIWDSLEAVRIPKTDNIVHSFRLLPQDNGNLYDPEYNWGSFLKQANEFTKDRSYNYVLKTDISDFFPSIYLHDIETVLSDALLKNNKNAHGLVLVNYIKAMHLNQTHKGLPVGPQFSRPIAELILDTLDRALIDQNVKFIRFMDDYIAFFKTEADAYNTLAFMAQYLYDTRNLKLNEKKTIIMPKGEFKKTHLQSHRQIASNNLRSHLYELLKELGLSSDPYDDIELSNLDSDSRRKLERLNLERILIAEMEKENEIDYGFISFLLSNLARIDNTNIADILLTKSNVRKLFPSLRAIISYLERLRSFSEDQKHTIGQKVLSVLEYNYVGNLSFNRMWLINLFTKNNEWDNESKFSALYNEYNDNITRREIFLALGRSQNLRFFRANKKIDLNMDPWLRRAFIAGISCLPDSERRPWFKARSLTSRDFLDQIVEKWAETNHF